MQNFSRIALIVTLALGVANPSFAALDSRARALQRAKTRQSYTVSSTPHLVPTIKPSRIVVPGRGATAGDLAPAKRDMTDYENLVVLRDMMTVELARIRRLDTQPFYAYFGENDPDIRRIDTIRQAYGEALRQVTLLVDTARSESLQDYHRKMLEQTKTYAASLSKEYDEIIKRLQCVFEKTCTLQKE